LNTFKKQTVPNTMITKYNTQSSW